MKNPHRAFLYGHIGLTAILAVLCLSANSNSFAQEGRKVSKVGLVDIGAVFNQYKKKVVLENQVNAMRQGLIQQYRAERQAIKALNDKAEQAEGEALDKIQFEIELRVQRSRLFKRRIDDKLKERLNTMTIELLQDIDRAIKRFGKEKSYAFILRVGGPDYSNEGVKNQLFQFQTQTASYHDPALDLTADIIAQLNKAEPR